MDAAVEVVSTGVRKDADVVAADRRVLKDVSAMPVNRKRSLVGEGVCEARPVSIPDVVGIDRAAGGAKYREFTPSSIPTAMLDRATPGVCKDDLA